MRTAIGVACFKTSGVMSAIGQATLYEQVVDCNAYGVDMFMFPCDEPRAIASYYFYFLILTFLLSDSNLLQSPVIESNVMR